MSVLSLSTFRQRGDPIVSAVGELDAETGWQLNTALRNQEPWLERVILDLRYLIRIDGFGIGAIVTADSRTRDRGFREMTFETCVARGSPASAVTPPAAPAAQRVAWMSGCSTSAVRPRERGSSG